MPSACSRFHSAALAAWLLLGAASSEAQPAARQILVLQSPAPINGALFTPFVTTKAHGLGIGLTIARTIVDAHGGSLDAHDNPEGGATFTITLRRSETPKILSGRQGAA